MVRSLRFVEWNFMLETNTTGPYTGEKVEDLTRTIA
jgi:hypothetical protein